ncbi:MAG: hypothetical protein D6702_12220 [Planctomycetota bacterium]|nr:MAG: hypothetical protein D6702_12220 [Planctomycetota bacterium]
MLQPPTHLGHRFSRSALGCVFEFVLPGEDEGALAAAAGRALDEVARIGRLVDPEDPGSELSRLNRLGGRRLVRVSRDLLDLLVACGQLGLRTRGHFDPTAPARCRQHRPADGIGAILVDPVRRVVRFRHPDTRLEFGGIARGHALDRAAAVLRAAGVAEGLLTAGPELALALDGGWQLGLRPPGSPDGSPALAHVPLRRRALANLAPVGADGSPDIVRPATGGTARPGAACAVIAPSAAEAEALSCALLAMGRRQAGRFCATDRGQGLRVAWLEDGLRWLRP